MLKNSVKQIDIICSIAQSHEWIARIKKQSQLHNAYIYQIQWHFPTYNLNLRCISARTMNRTEKRKKNERKLHWARPVLFYKTKNIEKRMAKQCKNRLITLFLTRNDVKSITINRIAHKTLFVHTDIDVNNFKLSKTGKIMVIVSRMDAIIWCCM